MNLYKPLATTAPLRYNMNLIIKEESRKLDDNDDDDDVYILCSVTLFVLLHYFNQSINQLIQYLNKY